MSLSAEISKKLKNFPSPDSYGDCILIEVGAENTLEFLMSSMKYLTDRNFELIMLSSSRPCTTLNALFKKKGINLDKIHILDTVCQSQGLNVADSKDVTHVEGISNLTDISIEIERISSEHNGQTILFIDSLTTMLMYNDQEIFYKFLHSILTKMRSKGINVAMVILKLDEYKPIKQKLGQLVDEIITV